MSSSGTDPNPSLNVQSEQLPKGCNCCGSPDYRLRWTIRGFPVVECTQCGLIYAIVELSPADLDRLYGEEFYCGMNNEEGYGYADYAAESEAMSITMGKHLDEIEQLTHGPGKILDVGCAIGIFLDLARKRSWKVEGCEVSSFAAKEAKRVYGLDIRVGELEQLAWDEGTFDAITMWDTIEHCRDPLATLQTAARLLRPGGILALSTGDIGSLTAKLWGKHWRLLQVPLHLFYFSAATIQNMLQRAGLQTVKFHHPGKRFTLGYVGFMVQTLFPNPVCRLAGELLRRKPIDSLQLYLNTFDLMTVLAQKLR